MEQLGWKSITPKRKKQLLTYLEGEVETLDQWIKGEIYGYTLTDSRIEDEEDSCWGFYGADLEAIFDSIGEKKEDWTEN